MTKKIILTGGPGTGKSSILLDLESRGEYIVREAAEDIIKLHQARGIEHPWENPNFQLEILKLQLNREERISKNQERVFIDRGIHDGLAYINEKNQTYRKILENTPQYNKIFLIENLGDCNQNKIRREDYEESLRIGQRLEQIYKEFGYNVQKIGIASVKKRTDRILEIAKSGNK